MRPQIYLLLPYSLSTTNLVACVCSHPPSVYGVASMQASSIAIINVVHCVVTLCTNVPSLLFRNWRCIQPHELPFFFHIDKRSSPSCGHGLFYEELEGPLPVLLRYSSSSSPVLAELQRRPSLPVDQIEPVPAGLHGGGPCSVACISSEGRPCRREGE